MGEVNLTHVSPCAQAHTLTPVVLNLRLAFSLPCNRIAILRLLSQIQWGMPLIINRWEFVGRNLQLH